MSRAQISETRAEIVFQTPQRQVIGASEVMPDISGRREIEQTIATSGDFTTTPELGLENFCLYFGWKTSLYSILRTDWTEGRLVSFLASPELSCASTWECQWPRNTAGKTKQCQAGTLG